MLTAVLVGFGFFALGMVAASKALAGKPGIQPRPAGLVIAGSTALATMLVYAALQYCGVTILDAQTVPGRFFGALLCLTMMAGLSIPVWQRSQAGSVLLDLGRPTRWLHLTVAGLVTMTALISWYTNPAKLTWQTLFSLIMAAGIVSQASTRLQIRACGIATNGGLLKWEKVKSFHWEKGGTVSLETTNFLRGKLHLLVPIEHVEALDRILMQYIGSHPPLHQ